MTIGAQAKVSNKLSFADLSSIATQLGMDAGKGKDTQIKMLLQLVDGGYHNAIDLEDSKHGTDIDDATKLAEVYVKAQTGATVFDAKAANQRKLISCFRTSIKLGMYTKGGTGEPLGTVNELMTQRQKLRADPTNAKKLDDAANTLLRYARAQIKRDNIIDHDELKSFCFKSVRSLATAEEIIAAQKKALINLKAGKAANGTALDNSPHITAAISALGTRLKEIAATRAAAESGTAAFTETV